MWSSLRSAYAWVLLSVIMLTLLPIAFVLWIVTTPFDARRSWLRTFVAVWSSLYGRLSPLYRFRIVGRERLPSEPYVLVANHESGLDVMCLVMLRTPARFLAESWIFRVPIAGWLFRVCRHIPLRVGDRESGARALAAAEEALREGSAVAIFPEGQLAPDGLAEFKPGAFVLAKRVGVPIVPVRIAGTGRAWRPGTMVVQGRHDITIEVHPPIGPVDVAQASEAALMARARAALGGDTPLAMAQ